jgi:glycerol-3-phosphate acyltransferase PlsY
MGSKNVGATNVLRNAGKLLGLLTLILDGFKGYAVAHYTGDMIAVLCVILGHIYPVQSIIKNKTGGKGISVLLGAMLGYNYMLFSIMIIVWLVIFLIKRISSLSSLSMVIVMMIVSYCLGYNIEIFLIIGFIIIVAHISNIQRLIKGQEKKL